MKHFQDFIEKRLPQKLLENLKKESVVSNEQDTEQDTRIKDVVSETLVVAIHEYTDRQQSGARIGSGDNTTSLSEPQMSEDRRSSIGTPVTTKDSSILDTTKLLCSAEGFEFQAHTLSLTGSRLPSSQPPCSTTSTEEDMMLIPTYLTTGIHDYSEDLQFNNEQWGYTIPEANIPRTMGPMVTYSPSFSAYSEGYPHGCGSRQYNDTEFYHSNELLPVPLEPVDGQDILSI